MERRVFLQNSSLVAAGLLASGLDAMGNQRYTTGTDPVLIKNLDPAWIKSLYRRGEPTNYLKSKNELQYIGMPVGGIMCGTVYLGGDGRLWLWDVFNKNQSGVIYKNVPWHEKVQFNFDYLRPFDGANYVMPVKDVRPLDQGFAIQVMNGDERILERQLNEASWDEVSFEATYPVATVRYIDHKLPLTVVAKIYSPFIPLNEADSALPVVIYSFTVENTFSFDAKITITGWLENKSAIVSANDAEYFRTNEVVDKESLRGVLLKPGSHNWADESFWSAPDYGNFCIASFGENGIPNTAAEPERHKDFFEDSNTTKSTRPYNEKLIASVGSFRSVNKGQTANFDFGIAWYFPNLTFDKLKNEGGRHYKKRFKSSADVLHYVHSNFGRLSSQSILWADTWYKESTLPHWFLERTFLNISTLATTTCHWFESGRFYAWEGIGSCPGTCNHVWQYAQAVGRIFPALERDTRERVDLGLALHDDGHIGFRGEYDTQPAVDGQAGRILGIYREHQMSADDSFLRRNWTKTKQAIEFLLRQDTNGDGMTDTQLENTLDAKWPGEIAWIVGLSLCAVRAGEEMAIEMRDEEFAERCRSYFKAGKPNMEKLLFNGEYFIHRPDAVKGRDGVIGSYNTCHIDQVYGQSWAFQVGLDRIIDRQKTLSALKALWKYNYTTDVGPYLKEHHGGRPYALPGEGGMIMNTNPRNEEAPYGVKEAWQVTYFHECMSGFEHQVAAHLMAEGMVEESLILTRTIHDRYHAYKRNPFNEVECSDHYARAMASYGTFITACGFTYHGPKKEIGFAPKLSADKFSAAFTAAEGWGTYSQQRKGKELQSTIEVKWGKLALRSIVLEKKEKAGNPRVMAGNEKLEATATTNGSRVTVVLSNAMELMPGTKLTIVL